jgi:hypothetical protein
VRRDGRAANFPNKSGDNFTREVVAAVLPNYLLQATRVRLAAVCAVTFGTATRLFEGRGRFLMWKESRIPSLWFPFNRPV